MKYLLLLLAFASCTASTESKLKNRVEEIEREQMTKEGLKVENMEVTNVHYFPCSKRNFLMSQIADGNLPYSDIRWKTADTTQKYFSVKYHLKANTNKVNIEREEKMYLLQSDLTQLNNASLNNP